VGGGIFETRADIGKTFKRKLWKAHAKEWHLIVYHTLYIYKSRNGKGRFLIFFEGELH
jgi:hypothetical protein